MEVMVFLLLLLATPGGSGAAWCTCRPDSSDPALQKTIDYACGAGADCNPILQNGACYNPNTVLSHCSYAANSYYQRLRELVTLQALLLLQQQIPAVMAVFILQPQGTSSASSLTPNSLNPSQTGTGVLGGLGPSGISTNIDGSAAAGFLSSPIIPPLLLTILLLLGLVFAQRS
ncbi:hypothetical protein M5K25_008932 [Dendrobium thyrsiflorum]|uniref:X8 domain-containing protein n=1 Tax=Dendrobium thyrsiflorum TaxID=117978 RepID=A0ABD0V9Z4_DENTH